MFFNHQNMFFNHQNMFLGSCNHLILKAKKHPRNKKKQKERKETGSYPQKNEPI